MKTIEVFFSIITVLLIVFLIFFVLIMADETHPAAIWTYSKKDCVNQITVEVAGKMRMYQADAIYRSIFDGEYIIKEGDVTYTVKAETALIKVDCGGQAVNGAVPQEDLCEKR